MSSNAIVTFAALLALYIYGVRADGTGLIGFGKTLYNPTCSFACRNVIRKQPLGCTPEVPSVNHGTAHNPVATPPDCFVKDLAFLKTMALCIDTYCPLSDQPHLSLVEDYWATHLGTGTLGSNLYEPVMSYHDALSSAREDEVHARQSINSTTEDTDGAGSRSHNEHHLAEEKDTDEPEIVAYNVSSPLPIAAGGNTVPLNVTSFIRPEDWQMQYNYMSDFEINEKGHSTMTITIAVIAIFLPVFLSVFRHIPGVSNSRGWSYVKSMLIYPSLWGQRHREPIKGIIIPTRGQATYIALISLLNIILLLAPFTITRPQASFTTRDMQTLSIIGNRAGVMAMGNVVALFLFAARNNILLYITDWSYGTYLLLHRWLGYWAIFHTALHSLMLLAYYIKSGTYESELARDYWIWGIVGTVAACALVPFSQLWVRQKVYEIFLASHIILALLFIVGYYYHIWYVYTYNWGYEIWIFVAGGIWGLDRVLRIARMVLNGNHTAVITTLDGTDGEYFRIDIEGKSLEEGVAYLCFPTLSWRFWETHPFSVAFSGIERADGNQTDPEHVSEGEKSVAVSRVTEAKRAAEVGSGRFTTTFLARSRSGITEKLTARIRRESAVNSPVRLRVLIEGPYHHSGGRIASQLKPCTSLVCIAGGVGITTCLPYMKQAGSLKSNKLFWSTRAPGLERSLAYVIRDLPTNAQVATVISQRLDLDTILAREMDGRTSDGPIAILVCGPPSMADAVRQRVVGMARQSAQCRPYIFIDEAFSW